MVPFGRCGAFPLGRGLAVVLGRGFILPLGRFRSPSVGRSRLLSPAGGFGVEVAGQDDRVQGQPAGNAVIRRTATTTSLLRPSTRPLWTTTPRSSSSGPKATS